MKSAIAIIGVFAALANAASFPRMMRRADNETITDGAAQTTLTVIQTNVETITSCAKTVTNCPADKTAIDQLPEAQKAVVTVTNTVVLKTTVCPVTEAAAVSSSVIQDADNGLITGSTVSIITTHIEPEAPAKTASNDYPVEDSDEKPETPKGHNNKPNGNKPEEESTTTTTATSTSTRTLTVPAATGSGSYESPNGNSGKGNGGNNGGSGGNGGDCVVSTVTVTAPASTVYVTVDGSNKTKDGSSSPTDVADQDQDAEDADDDEDDAEDDECVAGEGEDDEDVDAQDNEEGSDYDNGKPDTDKPVEGKDESPEDGEEDECPASTSSTAPEATVTVVPVPVTPTGEPSVTPGVANPTGFLRLVR